MDIVDVLPVRDVFFRRRKERNIVQRGWKVPAADVRMPDRKACDRLRSVSYHIYCNNECTS